MALSFILYAYMILFRLYFARGHWSDDLRIKLYQLCDNSAGESSTMWKHKLCQTFIARNFIPKPTLSGPTLPMSASESSESTTTRGPGQYKATPSFHIPFPFKKDPRYEQNKNNVATSGEDSTDTAGDNNKIYVELGLQKLQEAEKPENKRSGSDTDEGKRDKRIHMSQFVPLGSAQQTELQERYESRLKDYDSNRFNNRIKDAMSDLLLMSHGPNGGSNKWLRPSVPAIKNSSSRNLQRPYVSGKMSRLTEAPPSQKSKAPPISRQIMGIMRVGESPFKPVMAATSAINQPHAVFKAYTESITRGSEDEEYDEPTMVPYLPPPAVYRKVTLIQQRYAPYTLAVRLSNGCSGTLVTPLHAVTSAHCVYPGTSTNNHSLKVEVTEAMGYRVHYVADIYMPRRYILTKGNGARSSYARAVNDYAIITLNAPIPGRKEFPRIASVDVHRLGSMGQMHIIGYPKDTYPQMWQSSCSFLDSRPALGGSFVMSSCVSPRGMSGAAALLDNVRMRDEMKVVGIATNMVLNDPSSVGDQKKSLVLIFTPKKVAEICQQIKPWDEGRCA